MNIKTEIKEYGFPVTHNCVRSEARITELEAQLAAAQAEMQAMVSRLTKLAKELQTEETWDGKRNDALRYCAGRLRETIMRSQGSKKPRKAGRMR